MKSLTKEDVGAIWAQIKANTKRLEACTGPHEFPDPPPADIKVRYVKCRLCGGELGKIEAHWYMLGRKHERHHAND